MSVRMTARITFTPAPGQCARRFDDVTREAHAAGARFWATALLPRHFEPGAAGRYGYAPRSEKYLASRRKRGKPALVLSGDARADALASAVGGIRAFPSRVRISLDTPGYVPQRPRRSNMPHMAGEIFTVTPAEQTQIEEIERREAERRLRGMRDTRTVIIG